MKSTIPEIRRTLVEWYPPTRGTLKFNVDGASKGKPGPACIGEVLQDHLGSIRVNFSNTIKWARGVKSPRWKLITIVREIKGLSAGWRFPSNLSIDRRMALLTSLLKMV